MTDAAFIPASPSQASFKPAGNHGLYLLIDAVQYPAIYRILRYQFQRLTWMSVLNQAGQAQPGPVLAHVTDNQTQTLGWFLRNTRNMHCLSWIVSPLALLPLREHLRSLTRVETEGGARYAMRYYDTRILSPWYQMLDPEQEAYALAPITSWSYIARDHKPCSLFGYGQKEAPCCRTLQLSPVQERCLLTATLPDLVMRRLEENGNADLAALPRAQRHAFIVEQVDKARNQYGITSTQKIVLFCSLALGIGKNFDKLLPVTEAFQKFSTSNALDCFRTLQST